MNFFYKIIRPVITRGEKLNEDSVLEESTVRQAIAREESKHSKRRVMRRFYHSLNQLVNIAAENTGIKKVLDAGCARGEHTSKLAAAWPEQEFAGIDIIDEFISSAGERYRNIKNLAFRRENFLKGNLDLDPDLILCLETLEHIEDNSLQPFVENLFNYSRKALMVSVPREPFWCLANILRLKYLSRLGNTPSHLQHWTKKSFKNFMVKEAERKWGNNIEVYLRNPLNVWTIILILKKDRGS
jgi:2-polyprenyl-3-methyl-5-hydroxy-6-metoxy-1,4-benzoquinol methylase